MLSFFRRSSKSKVGTIVMALVLLAIIIGFAIADAQNFGSGTLSFGGNGSALATVGDERVTDADMSDAMQRRLAQVREQNPGADYGTIANEFDPILSALIDERALVAFANANGFRLSKRLIDAEIAQLPGTRGLNGQFSDQAYQAFLQQQRMTDAQLRRLLASSLLQRLVLAPVVANPRVPVGLATPYANMMLEAREGEAASIPIELFRSGLNPSDADLQRYYASNRGRYTVPEQRVIRIARIGAEQVANVQPSDQEIAAFYNANQAIYGAKDTRSLSQVVVPDQQTAAAIAARARQGGTLAAAAAPAGSNAAVTRLPDQTREAYSSVAGARAAQAVFSAAQGAVVGPTRSDFGWVVVKVESIKREGGRSLAQARGEIAERLAREKRGTALEEMVDKVQTAIDDGANFAEAAAAARLETTTTPLIMPNGRSRVDPAYRAPADLAKAITEAFKIAPNDPPEIIPLGENQGYALMSPAQVVPAAPAPLASIRDQVRNDWIESQALIRARAAASAIAAKAARGMPLARAVREAGVALPAVRPMAARRIEIANANAVIPPAMRMLFTLPQGKSRMVADPRNGGFFVVKVNKIVPGNALLQPALIARMQTELQQAIGEDYAAQLINAIRADVKIKRNESAIAAAKQRMTASGF
ncbi:peptidylprolyl isomerase [Sphingomonas lutea]|uniref:Parvulin-like PPIase n=1 Tax=Sphingomonas lutea TaxID=1045317 RepID=A0A7G9SFX5_9SPHN|nr:peptidylprolyl isomerase [Sphingomonas lutea]QNN66750.1 peptidylprolyl isomerase [Sphingomonas lutea]